MEPYDARGPTSEYAAPAAPSRGARVASALLLLVILGLLVGGLVGISIHRDTEGEMAEPGPRTTSPTTASTSPTTSATTTAPSPTAAPGPSDLAAPATGGTGATGAGTGGAAAGASGGTATTTAQAPGGSTSSAAGDGGTSSPVNSMPNTGAEPMVLPGLLLLASAAGARRLAVVSRRR